MKSKVHPTYKTKYRVANWSAYDRALLRRGDVTLWLAPEAVAAWEPDRVGTRGGQLKYSDLAIETALTLRRAISTDILDFCARVLAIQGGKGRLMDSDSDPGHGSARLLVRSRGPVLPGRRLQTHGPAGGRGREGGQHAVVMRPRRVTGTSRTTPTG